VQRAVELIPFGCACADLNATLNLVLNSCLKRTAGGGVLACAARLDRAALAASVSARTTRAPRLKRGEQRGRPVIASPISA
jgi:hypothetical protein